MARTFRELKQQVIDDLDLQDEIFVTEYDLYRWLNDAIESAEAQIHTLYEDYFLSRTEYTISSGEYLLDYPSDIYASKVRKMLFKESNNAPNTASHEILREKDLITAEARDIYENSSSQPTLTWIGTNSSSEGRKVRLFPKLTRNGIIVMYYIRNAAKVVYDSNTSEWVNQDDVCDIDEFERYLVQAVKTQVYLKDGDIRAEDSKGLEEQLKKDMVETLSNRVPDNNDEIVMDLSHYSDML